MDSALRIVTLGGLDIQQAGRALGSLGSLRAEALFVYLACTRHTYSRDALVDLLWDELTASQGLNNLRWLLSLLRRQLTPYLHITAPLSVLRQRATTGSMLRSVKRCLTPPRPKGTVPRN